MENQALSVDLETGFECCQIFVLILLTMGTNDDSHSPNRGLPFIDEVARRVAFDRIEADKERSTGHAPPADFDRLRHCTD